MDDYLTTISKNEYRRREKKRGLCSGKFSKVGERETYEAKENEYWAVS